MKTFNLHTAEYCVSRFQGLSLDEALRFWKAKFESIEHFKQDVIKHPSLKKLEEFAEEIWDDIKPITAEEALLEQNMEKRRTMFDCIGVSRLFQSLEPELLDKQVIRKVRTRWNEDNQPYEYRYDDHYELYRISGDKLFIAQNKWSKPNPVYAVRCWCTTTGREFWIYVPEEAALGTSPQLSGTKQDADAVRAIAWTIRIDVSNPRRIYRQGDIIIAEESEDSETVPSYHLSKEQYLNLMYSET